MREIGGARNPLSETAAQVFVPESLNSSMKLTIDNLDGQGARDYTASLDSENAPKILRRLNRPAQMRFGLVTGEANFVVPPAGARVILRRNSGADLFAGYVSGSPTYHYLGWGERGPLYRYELSAFSDEIVADRQA